MEPDLSKLVDKETIRKVYDDLLSGPAKETGKILTELIKTVHLFTTPLQLIATLQDRLAKYLIEVSERVPKEKQVPASESYAGEIIDRLSFISETDYLKDYYLNLLENSINHDLLNLAHPAFPTILHQLSRDEIFILESLKKDPITISFEYDKIEKEIKNEKILEASFDLKILSFSEYRRMYFNHLQFLDLIRITSEERESYNPNKNCFHRKMKYKFSELGELFMKACSR